LALGYGSLYNHSYHPNARYDDAAGPTKVFTALRDIAAGEEITVNYNGEPDDGSSVGFRVVDGAPPEPGSESSPG
jgi:SET domain-containing protein